MADPSRNLESILAALAAQKAPTPTALQGQPGIPPAYPPPQPNYHTPPASAPYQPPASYPYPQPTSSGSLDLNALSGAAASNTSSIQDAIARARAHAAQNGATPYDRPLNYAAPQAQPQAQPRPVESGRYRSSRSRSPAPRRGDNYRDNHNPYRDERREDRGSQRDYGRDRSFSPRIRERNSDAFSPRVGNGARQRSPMRGGGGDDNSETIQIESGLVGLIIGRQGENLRRVETDSHCRVQFLSAVGSNEAYRECKISGPPSRRAEAKLAIERIIEDSGMGAIARAGLDRGGPPGGRDAGRGPPPAIGNVPQALKDGEESIQIMVPDRTVGLIIGRGGETIRDLQERSGCHVNIVGENKSINGLRPVNLIGPPQAAQVAKTLIMEIVDSDSRNGNNPPQHGQSRGGQRDGFGGGGGQGDKTNDSIYVPSEAVGMIIGKGGETIREMQNQTACKINVSQSSGPGEVEREIGLVGSRDAIERAKRAIEDKVDAVRQKSIGGGGRGGRGGGGGGGGGHRDYDDSGYGQAPPQPNAAPTNTNQAMQPSAGADGSDPYAAFGGYQAYVAAWYQALAHGQMQGQMPGQSDPSKPPGAA